MPTDSRPTLPRLIESTNRAIKLVGAAKRTDLEVILALDKVPQDPDPVVLSRGYLQRKLIIGE